MSRKPPAGARTRRDVSDQTTWRRGGHVLTADQVRIAKLMRDRLRWGFAQIGGALRVPEADVRVALNRTRSPNPDNERVMFGGKRRQLAPFNAFAPHEGASRCETMDEVLRLAAIGKAAEVAGFRLP